MMSYKKKMIWNYNDGKLRSLIYWKIFVYIWYTYNIRWWSKLKYKICIQNPFPFCEKVYPTQQRKVKEMLDYLKQDENIKSITLFGSSITSNCHNDSDIDLYIELKKDKKVINRYFDFVFDLWTNFTADERLKKEIKKKGVVIYEQ